MRKSARSKCVMLAVAGATVGLLLTACGQSTDSLPVAAPPNPDDHVRKNVKTLSPQEKADFVAAVKKLKTMPAPEGDVTGNWYDHFVAEHMQKLICWTDQPDQGGYGHNGPDLLTWHRAFLMEFESALSTAAGKPMAIPYWDWTDETSTAAVFTNDFMGPPGKAANKYVVTEGPFRKGEWRINVKGFPVDNPGQFDDLVRATGKMAGMTTLPPYSEVEQALAKSEYDTAPWGVTSDSNRSFRAFIDGAIGATGTKCDQGIISVVGATSARLHASVHMWVGGMTDKGEPGGLTDTVTSPNDPIFWLHHANIDRITEQWWKTHNYQYLPISGGPRGDNIDDVLAPYTDKTNGDMAKPTKQLGYRYDTTETHPTGSSASPTPSGSGSHSHGGQNRETAPQPLSPE